MVLDNIQLHYNWTLTIAITGLSCFWLEEILKSYLRWYIGCVVIMPFLQEELEDTKRETKHRQLKKNR